MQGYGRCKDEKTGPLWRIELEPVNSSSAGGDFDEAARTEATNPVLQRCSRAMRGLGVESLWNGRQIYNGDPLAWVSVSSSLPRMGAPLIFKVITEDLEAPAGIRYHDLCDLAPASCHQPQRRQVALS